MSDDQPASPFREMFKAEMGTTPTTLAEYVQRVAALACIQAHWNGQRLTGAPGDVDAANDYAAEYTHSGFDEEVVREHMPPLFTQEHLIALQTLLDEADAWIGERYSGQSLARLRVLQGKAEEALEVIAALLPPTP